MSTLTQGSRIFLPLQSMSECHACGSTKNLRICSGCGERTYCSRECQFNQWKEHKPFCKTNRIGVATIYPIFAFMVDQVHFSALATDAAHPGLKHKILSDEPETSLPDGTIGRLIRLGPPFSVLAPGAEPSPDRLQAWHPTGNDMSSRFLLMDFFMRHGPVAPSVLSVCLAILETIYTTATVPSSSSSVPSSIRTRLRYRSSPVVDFGICSGSVTPEPSTLSKPLPVIYQYEDGTILPGPDRENHLWIYFDTLNGERILLDSNLFSMGQMDSVDTGPYHVEPYSRPIPAVFFDRSERRRGVLVHQERKSFSILRNLDLHQITWPSNSTGDIQSLRAVASLLDTIKAPSHASETDRDLCLQSTVAHVKCMQEVIQSNRWKSFPVKPEVFINMPVPPGPAGEAVREQINQVRGGRKDSKKAQRGKKRK
ncbi:hypothetical protein JAAARDRAFT_543707 [Jaapia argillacea MUCL 33604]|uniref:MYND-type domain-containing protein n=1 Tax=Jaapia argillacea MUCL 33604 TaxID=933084 RepID=A0A067PAZ0_9AGAM|nr:hypothetical protein JAAARDRAFT_543707 [Jaapia argillacea MUCL 33604]